VPIGKSSGDVWDPVNDGGVPEVSVAVGDVQLTDASGELASVLTMISDGIPMMTGFVVSKTVIKKKIRKITWVS